MRPVGYSVSTGLSIPIYSYRVILLCILNKLAPCEQVLAAVRLSRDEKNEKNEKMKENDPPHVCSDVIMPSLSRSLPPKSPPAFISPHVRCPQHSLTLVFVVPGVRCPSRLLAALAVCYPCGLSPHCMSSLLYFVLCCLLHASTLSLVVSTSIPPTSSGSQAGWWRCVTWHPGIIFVIVVVVG